MTGTNASLLRTARTPPGQELFPIDRPVAVGVNRIEAIMPLGGRHLRPQAVEELRVLGEIDALIAVQIALVELLFGIGQFVAG